MNDERTPEPDLYDVDQMALLNDLEHVRNRAGMYIGNLESRGLHHLVQEVVDNSIDEVLAGAATQVKVTVNPDESITIVDDGRGIPIKVDNNIGKSALEGVMTILKYGGKFGSAAYDFSGGLHGMGLKAVNFLSEWCEVEVCRDGRRCRQRYETGVAMASVEDIGRSTSTGTTITFKPDGTMFGQRLFEREILERRLRESAYLNAGTRIEFLDRRVNEAQPLVFQFARGLTAFIEFLNLDREALYVDVIRLQAQTNDWQIDVALQHTASAGSTLLAFANNIHNPSGGTHMEGLKAAIARAVRSYAKRVRRLGVVSWNAEDFREGLTAVISLRGREPSFESQNKLRLINEEVEAIVRTEIGERLQVFLEEHPRISKAILDAATHAAQIREMAKAARKAIRAKTACVSGGLPGKLRDCSATDVSRRELYLVEGDSAGGSAEGGRMRETQAILPLRGKIINAYKATTEKLISNEEIASIVQALGIGVGDVDLAQRRYDKVIIMTDADIDGSHIRTLLLSFFYRQMFPLVSEGHVYIARPPLFRIGKGTAREYVADEAAMSERLLDAAVEGTQLTYAGERTIQDSQLRRLVNAVEKLLAFDDATELTSALWRELAVPPTTPHHRKDLQDVVLALATERWTFEDVFATSRLGEEQPRLTLQTGKQRQSIARLLDLPRQMRAIGESRLQVTRFKGLGEMNADELRHTTLDPNRRDLAQVTVANAQEADALFQLLMGEAVQPRREFIEANALSVRQLDV